MKTKIDCRLFLCLLFVLPPQVGQADSSADWVATALAKNPALTAAKQKWEAAKQKVPQARALEDPMIGVDVERMGTTRFDKYSDNEVMISQKLPWFGKRGAKASVAQLEAEVIGFQYLELVRSLRGQVIAAEWDLWLAQRSATLAAENRQLMEQMAQAARARYEAGKGTQAELLRAEMELARLANEVITMDREVEVAQSVVNKLLAAEPATPRQVVNAPELPAQELSLEELQAQARAYCCMLMSFLRTVEAKEAGVRVAKLASAPDVEFRVEARQYNGHSGFQEYDTGVFLNFPWLWRGKYRAMRQEAKAEVAMAQADFDNEVNATMLEIKELYTKAETAGRLVKVFEDKLLPQSNQLIEATRAAYESGGAGFLELVEAQRTWRDAQLEHARARAAAGKAHAQLDAIAAPWGKFEFATGLVTEDMK